jgi:hypothetical protein
MGQGMTYQIGDMVSWWSYAVNAYETGYVVAVEGQGTMSIRVRFFKGFDRIVYADRRLKKVKEH